jgi:hypothetical protein
MVAPNQVAGFGTRLERGWGRTRSPVRSSGFKVLWRRTLRHRKRGKTLMSDHVETVTEETTVGTTDHHEHGNEAVGAGAGALAGAGVGMVVGGPVGAAVGGVVGAVGGAAAGESTEGRDEAGAGVGAGGGAVAGAVVGGLVAGPPGAVVGGAVGAGAGAGAGDKTEEGADGDSTSTRTVSTER